MLGEKFQAPMTSASERVISQGASSVSLRDNTVQSTDVLARSGTRYRSYPYDGSMSSYTPLHFPRDI